MRVVDHSHYQTISIILYLMKKISEDFESLLYLYEVQQERHDLDHPDRFCDEEVEEVEDFYLLRQIRYYEMVHFRQMDEMVEIDNSILLIRVEEVEEVEEVSYI